MNLGSESTFEVVRAEQPRRSCAKVVSDPGFSDSGLDPYVERILKASVYDVAIESPLNPAPRLSRRLGAEVLLKREDLQPVHSFKLRGAANRIAALSAEEARHGVICASAGNHAQGVALAAQRRGIAAVVVMPVTTPRIKVEAVRELEAEVVLHGDDFDQACACARELERARGMIFVHPFDDPWVIAGQGTVAMEILRQCDGAGIEAVFVPVGGGGLIAGMSAWIKSLHPHIKVIGVEPDDAPTLERALAAGKPVRLGRVGAFADGAAVREVGRETFALARRYVDEVILVGADETCAAIQDLFEETRTIAEPAGALAVAGMKRYAARSAGIGVAVAAAAAPTGAAAARRAAPVGATSAATADSGACPATPVNRRGALVAVVSGANLNFDRLRHVAERADLGARREAVFAVEIPERPGSFLRFCEVIGRRAVTEFNYRYADPARAHIFVGLALADPSEREAVRGAIAASGCPVTDLSDNEMAKLHVRYMVGGRAPAADERVFRFEFPERPGALLEFLGAVGGRWNISLFHYRNHGADRGRVLAGIQVDAGSSGEFDAHLEVLGFPYVEETANPAYRAFL
jgi:threonine dehydratase